MSPFKTQSTSVSFPLSNLGSIARRLRARWFCMSWRGSTRTTDGRIFQRGRAAWDAILLVCLVSSTLANDTLWRGDWGSDGMTAVNVYDNFSGRLRAEQPHSEVICKFLERILQNSRLQWEWIPPIRSRYTNRSLLPNSRLFRPTDSSFFSQFAHHVSNGPMKLCISEVIHCLHTTKIFSAWFRHTCFSFFV